MTHTTKNGEPAIAQRAAMAHEQNVSPTHLSPLLAIEYACFDFWQYRPVTVLLQEVLGISVSTADQIALGMHPLSFEAVARFCAHTGLAIERVASSAGMGPAVDQVTDDDRRFVCQLSTTTSKQRQEVEALLYLPRYLAFLGNDDGIRAFARAYATLTQTVRDKALVENPFSPGTRPYFRAIALTSALPGFAHETRQPLSDIRKKIFAAVQQWWGIEHGSAAYEELIECSWLHMGQQYPALAPRRKRGSAVQKRKPRIAG